MNEQLGMPDYEPPVEPATFQEAKDKKFIQKAIKRPGQLHKDLGVPQGEPIPPGKLRAAAKKKGKVGQRARFALTLKGLSKKKSK